jgi:flagellar assembly protein FliH
VGREFSTRVEVFQYPSNANPPPVLWEVLTEIGSASDFDGANSLSDQLSESDAEDRESSRAIGAEETKRAFEAGREQGRQEAQAAAADEQRTLLCEAKKKRMDQAVSQAVELASERDDFLQKAEQEIVKLALAIAARILRREAQIDPLFLLGAVRVALGQLAETIQVKLRIPAREAKLWTETLAHLPNPKKTPLVIADDHMQMGDCVIETEMGSVNLGLSSQLQESGQILFHGSSVHFPDIVPSLETSENEERM